MEKPEESSESQEQPTEQDKQAASILRLGVILGAMDDKSLETVNKLTKVYKEKFKEKK